jgi:hypothetical protein
MNQNLPIARKDSLIVKELPDETLIYDTERDKAHCLNSTAALVWKNCDGKKTVDQLRDVMEHDAGTPVPEEMVWLALDQLNQFSLLETPVTQPPRFANMSRRQMIRVAGAASIAAPMIFSIVAPRAAEAQSLLPPGACCGSPGQCQSNSCNQSPTCIGIPQPSTKACA